VSTPILYIKEGCPYCADAREYLDQQEIVHEEVDVRGNEEKMKKLKKISGQTKTPTMVWDDKVLADFGVDELKGFLAERDAAKS
jgi:glutaredoxin